MPNAIIAISIRKVPPEQDFDVGKMLSTMKPDVPPIPYYNRHIADNPWWYNKASEEPQQINSQGNAIG
jgi:hypothetical protein